MRRAFTVALLAVAFWAAPAASETYGPAFGANSFTSSIDTVDSVFDTDDYVAPLAAGETLTVTITAARYSPLRPALTLIAPDGAVWALRPPWIIEKKGGSVVLLRSRPILETGRWTVRVSGLSGTQGRYTITFKIGAAKDQKLTAQHLGGADPLTRDVSVEALDGSLLDVTVTWPKTESVVQIGSVKDPAGGEDATGTPPVVTAGSAKVSRRLLHQGTGTYTVLLSIVSGESTYAVTTHVTAPARPRGRKPVVLYWSEPFLDVRATPVRGDGGLTAHLTGTGFPVSPPPQVLFGGVPGTDVVVTTDGRSLDVVVPAGTPSSTVELAVIQADGQASVRAHAFVYVPLPTITDLVDASSASVSGGSTAGGASLTFVGTGFVPGDVIRFGTGEATEVVVLDSTHVRFSTPAHEAGLVPVAVTDEFGRTVVATFQYEFKDPPAFRSSPYSQVYANTAGGTTITTRGTGFEPADQLRFNGSAIASTFVDSTTRTFNSPAISAGSYSVALVDRLGLTAAGPEFTVKDPPTFAATPYSPAFANTAGGTTVTIGGTGFESTDKLRFNGSDVASTFVSSTSRTFSAPSIAAGAYAVALVDRFGQSVAGPNFTVKDAPAFASSPYSPAFANTGGGTTITITGNAFESTDQLVFNGANLASVFVNSTTRRFTSPSISAGSCTVSLIDRLGQISAGPNFAVKDPPAFAATPYSPAFANTVGGATITIAGSGFESTDQLKFNGSNVASTFVSSTSRTLSTPPIAAGSYAMALVDRFGQTVNGPNFTVKDPPTFAATPYSPAFAGTAGGSTITITGAGFESADQLRFNGSNVTSTFVSSTTRTFTSPAIAAGSYAVSVVDRFNQTANGPSFTVKDPPTFAASPYSPSVAPTYGGVTVTITGTGFESTDQLVFNGSNLTSTFVSSTTRTFASPALSAGFCSVALVDRFNQTATGPTFELRSIVPAVSSVQATAGPHIGNTKIAANGGATIQVTGSGFLTNDTVTLGGASATITSLTSTQIAFTAPAGTFGTTTLVVADGHGNSASSNALTYVGFGDVTATGLPGTSSVDNWIAQTGTIGDLDNDGSKDDLVVTTLYAWYNGSNSLGTRSVFTRMLFGQSGVLSDVTSTNVPGVSASGDQFGANAVAIGDVDGDADQDVVIAGFAVSASNYSSGASYTLDARIFSNNGSGTFTQSAYSPRFRTTDVTCTGSSGGTYTLFRPGPWGATATGLAIGDLDGDGDAEIVMATNYFRTGLVYINPSYVTFTPGSYYDAGAASHSQVYGTTYYAPALRIFDNRGTSGFEDVTFPRLPLCGTPPSVSPCFIAQDVKLGDIDGDPSGSLDIVLTWNYPTSTTPVGLDYYTYGDTSRVCTKVLINNGSGFFTDQTSTWMPAGSSPEFWQGNRLELADLDGDGKKDLVILSIDPLDGVTTTTSSLRILHNTGSAFVDVTSTALPSVPLPGTLDDNLRGNALVVRDVDGDGNLDIVVGIWSQLLDTSGSPVRSTRLLLGDGALHFALANEFLPPASVDTGEAADLLIGDIAGNGAQSLILVDRTVVPATSTNGERMRRFDWK